MDGEAFNDPLRPDVPAAAIRTTRVQRAPGCIARIQQLTHDTVELVVRREPGTAPFLARAGQFATLTIPGIKHPRAYSFACDPAAEAAREHSFQIRLVEGGEMSTWLGNADRTGTPLEIAGPLGRFGLDDSQEDMVLLAGGSGLSAIKAIAEEAARLQVPRHCLLVHGARTAADLHSGEGLAALAAQWHADFRYRFVQVLSDEPANSSWRGARGLITDYLRKAWLETGEIEPDTMRAWICGPPAMIEATETMLRTAGVSNARIHRDVFEDRSAPAPQIDDRRCVLCDECLLVRPVENCIVESGSRPSAAGSVEALQPLKTSGLYYNGLVVDPAACIRCSACVQVCPHDAISIPRS